VAAVTVAVLAGASGCGDELDRRALTESFQRDFPDATATEASCVVDDLLDRFTLDEIEAEMDSGQASAPFANATVAAMASCGYDLSAFEPWMLTMVANLTRLGFEPDEARCAAERLSGQLTGDEVEQLTAGELPPGFRSRLVEALAACEGP
jgi:hypothetical protein